MTVTPISTAKSLRIADARKAIRHVFIHDMVVDCSIGVYRHEHKRMQKVRINLDLAVNENDITLTDDLDQVVCYEAVANKVRAIAAEGHTKLVETFAEKIAVACLLDPRILSIRIRVEKLEALEDAESVGVEIERFRTP